MFGGRGQRDSSNVKWSREYGGYWDVRSHAECRAVAGARSGFSSYPHVHLPPSGLAERGVRIYALESDDPEHRAERAVLREAVGTVATKQLEPSIRDIARGLLMQLDWNGPVDLAADFAYRLPLEVIAGVVGVPTHLKSELREHTNTLLFRRGTSDEALAAAERIAEIAAQTIAARQGRPGGDWLDELIGRLPEHEFPLESEAVRAVVALITGGHHSTSRAIGSLLARVYGDLVLRDLLIAQSERIPDAAEEVLRLHTPLPTFSRKSTTDHEIDGCRVTAGEQALLRYDAANRDPRVFRDPERFDIERRNREHLAFGWGAHRCVGMHLAQSEMRIALEEVLREAPDAWLLKPVHWVGPAEPEAVLVTSAEPRSDP
jgi:cytochrome P450